jgi:hypothetical protein
MELTPQMSVDDPFSDASASCEQSPPQREARACPINSPGKYKYGGLAFDPWAAAATDADKVALQRVTASGKAEVKEYAKYNETSCWQRHKILKKCINDASAKK